jgi:hypothetical protein
MFILVAGLYWFGGDGGVALLWGLGALFLLPQAVTAPIGLFRTGRQKLSEQRWGVAATYLLGWLLLTVTLWGIAGYCAYRAYEAVLLAPGLYRFVVESTAFLLWLLAASLLLLAGILLMATYFTDKQKLAARGRFGKAAYLLQWLLTGLAWLAAIGYCLYRAFAK